MHATEEAVEEGTHSSHVKEETPGKPCQEQGMSAEGIPERPSADPNQHQPGSRQTPPPPAPEPAARSDETLIVKLLTGIGFCDTEGDPKKDTK